MRRERTLRRLVRAIWPVAVLLLAGSACARAEEFRGLWVDAWGPDLWSASGVSTVVSNARAGHFNALVCQVRRRADSLYRITPYEPVCTDVAPGYDPLADLITQSHDTSGGKQRLEVHAWLVTYHAWGGTNAAPAGHPYVLHPDWLMLDSSSNALQTFDPGHPEVQKQTFNVAMNILTNYDVDGLNLDYIRYSSTSEGYNSTSVARFNLQTGRSGTPAPEDEVWKQWRRDQVTALLRKVYLTTISLRPSVKVSCDTVTWSPAPLSDASWTNSRPYQEVLQDWRGWMQEGIMDLNLPMCYFRAYDAGQAGDFAAWRDFILGHQYDRYGLIGPGAFLNAIPDTISQMRQEQGTSGHGICLNGYKVTNKDGLPRSEFINALVTPSSYDPITPAIFAQQATAPTLPWKSAPTRGHLQGSLYGGGTTNPLDGAAFTLEGPVYRSGISDATAFYGAVDLPPGTYTLTAWCEGFAPVTTQIAISAGAVTTADVVLPAFGAGTAPAMLREPQSRGASLGGDASFDAAATGSAPLTYQWLFNGGSLAGGTGPSLLLHNLQFTNAGGYSVRVGNGYGSITSSVATLTVTGAPPLITVQPQSRMVIAGGNASLSLCAEGSAPMSYQWLHNTAPVGDNSPALEFSNVQVTVGGDYFVRVTNAYGAATSSVASLAVHYALNAAVNGSGMVTRSPSQASYVPGSTVTLMAHPDSNANFIEWSGDAAGTDNPRAVTLNSNLTMVANFRSLTLVPEIILDNTNAEVAFYGAWQTGTNPGKYGPDYRYAFGSLNGVSNALFVPNLPVDGKYDVFIWYNEGSNRATNAPWTIYSSGGTETCYVDQQTNGGQWLKIASAKEFAAGTNGYVRLSNQIGVNNKVVMADAVKFVYVAAPFIASGPQSQTVVAGQEVTLMVNTAGAEPFCFQWQKNQVPLPGANGPAFGIPSARYADAGSYSVTVSNALGRVGSPEAVLEVLPPVIQAFTPLEDGRRRFQVNWAAPSTVVEATSDFTNWHELPNLAWATNSLEAQDLETNGPGRFYRTKLP